MDTDERRFLICVHPCSAITFISIKMSDKKAQQILFQSYWSIAGRNSEPRTSKEEFKYALKAGYMFEPINTSHDEIVDWVGKSFKKVNLQQVSDAFLSSLSNRRLDWRSALGSYAIARHFPQHKFSGERLCNVCGETLKSKAEDLSVLNFERLKWGGVRHLSPLYVAFDLEQFSKIKTSKPNPSDFEIFNQIIEKAKSLDPAARPRDLEKAISKIVKSNQSEREILIQILGFCGILQTPKYKGFFETFVNYNQREIRPVNKIDWDYPISWWQGKDGVNEKALNYFFPQL